MSEEGMIPNDPEINKEETPVEEGLIEVDPEVTAGEEHPEAEAREFLSDTSADHGDLESSVNTLANIPEMIPPPEVPVESAPDVEADLAPKNEAEEDARMDAEAEGELEMKEKESDSYIADGPYDPQTGEEVDTHDDHEGDAFPHAGRDEPGDEHLHHEVDEDAFHDNTGDSADSLLTEIMGDHTNFDAIVEKATPNELALLMETIAQRGKVSDFVQKVLSIRKDFDKKTDDDTLDTALKSRFHTALAKFNKRRTAYYAEREKEKEENSRKKRELLDALRQIVQEEQVTKIQEIREIQTKWREIGWVMQKDLQPLNETYRQYLDIFYNLRSKYQDLLDLDRKYNLDQKQKVIDEIEALIPSEEGITREEWTARSARVKSFQEEWRTIGLVPRDNLEEINASFRDVLDRFYELRSGYYELQDQQKTENAEAKKALLEKLRPYGTYTSDKAKAWNEATRKVLALQEEWKKIGPGPLDANKQLWKDYRQVCDTFFNNKGEFFKTFDDQRSDNLKKKIEICEKAEALAEKTEWKDTAKALKDLQEDWKKIGPVHERHSNKVWKRFRKACDTFFERRGQASSAEKNALDDNLKIKEALIAKLEALVAEGGNADAFQEIQTQWKATGHVPFKQKDRINNAFKEAISKYFEKSRSGRHDHHRHKVETEVANLTDSDARARRLQGEIRKLRIRIQELEGKVKQYEINIQYINKGKSGESLRKQIQDQIDGEKNKIKELRTKVKEYQNLIDNPPATPEPEHEEPTAEHTEAVEHTESIENTEAVEHSAPAEIPAPDPVEAPEDMAVAAPEIEVPDPDPHIAAPTAEAAVEAIEEGTEEGEPKE